MEIERKKGMGLVSSAHPLRYHQCVTSSHDLPLGYAGHGPPSGSFSVFVAASNHREESCTSGKRETSLQRTLAASP